MNYSLYSRTFKKRREQCLAEAGYRCSRCKVRDGSLKVSNRTRRLYFLYLVAAHVFSDQKHCPDAALICLCPSCHWKFDNPRTDEDFEFIDKVVRMYRQEVLP